VTPEEIIELVQAGLSVRVARAGQAGAGQARAGQADAGQGRAGRAVGEPAAGEPGVREPVAGKLALGEPGGVACEVSQGSVTVLVPPGAWLAALAFARDELGCDFFDWLTAVDELDAGLAVVAHVYSLTGRHHLLVRTLLAPGSAVLPTATAVYRGAAWHERETHEMFGVAFEGHPALTPLLLPDGFEGYPLRKEFVLAARVARAWPGAKDPGEAAGGGRRVRRTPPGVPGDWRPR
jgi:NADH-quinone oxidoreductase subunit C